MRCLYCESVIHTYPENGTCPNCGGTLPQPAQPPHYESPLRVCPSCGSQSHSTFCPDCGRNLTVATGAPPVAVPNEPPIPGRTCCPRCYSRDIFFKKRGFSWGWALLGFCLMPFFGALCGFIGFKKLRYRCRACSHKWTID